MGRTWEESHSNSLPLAGGLADVATRGTTETGLDFEFIKQMPLPGTAGCATTWGNPDSLSVGIDFRYDNFRYWDSDNDMEQSYDKPDLDSLTIDWGDGNQYQETPPQMMGNGYQYHTYDNSGEYPIEITFTPVTGYTPVVHTYTYVASEDDSGFRMYDEEGNPSGDNVTVARDEGLRRRQDLVVAVVGARQQPGPAEAADLVHEGGVLGRNCGEDLAQRERRLVADVFSLLRGRAEIFLMVESRATRVPGLRAA